jgi:nicotinamide riboside kinase
VKAVINFFGGPGTGKSTLASNLFVEMKKRAMSCELINEYAKELTWESRHNILKHDQLYIFAKQHRKIYRVAENVDYAICDSPLLLSAMYYDKQYNVYDEDIFDSLVVDTFNKYPNLNFYIKRSTLYDPIGRNQTEDEAKEIDERILRYLDKHRIECNVIGLNFDYNINHILDTIRKQNVNSR